MDLSVKGFDSLDAKILIQARLLMEEGTSITVELIPKIQALKK